MGTTAARPAGHLASDAAALLQRLPVAVFTCDAAGRVTQFNDAAAALWGRAPTVGEDFWYAPWRLFRPDGTPMPLEECPMAVALRDGHVVSGGTIIIERPDGSRRTVMPHPQPIFDETGRLRGVVNTLVVLPGAPESERILAQTRASLDAHTRDFDRLHQLSLDLARERHSERALELVLTAIMELQGADCGTIFVTEPGPVGEQTPRFRRVAAKGFDAAGLAALDGVVTSPGSVCMRAFATASRVSIEDLEAVPLGPRARDLVRAGGFRSIHCTPAVMRSGAVVGVISLYFRSPRRLVEREVQVTDICAQHVGDILETSRTARALFESERRFSLFMTHLPGAAWIKDASGRYIYVNPEATRIFPAARGDIIDRTDDDIFPPATAREFRENDERALATGNSIQTVEHLRQADGAVHHSIVHKFVLPGADGAPAMIGGVAFDITDRVRAQEALEASESRFRAVAMNAPAAIFIKDLEGRYILTNPVASRALGRPEGVAGLTDRDLLPAPLAEYVRAQDRRVLAQGRALEAEEVMVSQGGPRTYLSVKFPILNPDGVAEAIGGVAIDITERQRAIQERRDAADLLEGSINALTSHIAILDRNGVILKVNRAWRTFGEANGFAGNHFGVGTNYLEACTPHGEPVSGCALEAAYAAQGIREVIAGAVPVFVMEYPCHAPRANRWFTMRVTRFGEGERLRVVVAHEDVTERHEAEQIIVQNADRLRLATAAANLGTWDLDPRTRNLSCDNRCMELLGIDTHEVSLDDLRAGVHPDDQRRLIDAALRAFDPNGSGTFEIEFRFTGVRDGIHRWIRANGQARFEHDQAVRFLGTLKDITGFKRADEALRRSEEMLRLATDAAGIGTWTRDLSTNTVRWSPKLEELFGLRHGSFAGTEAGFFEYVHPEDRAKVAAAVERAIREKSDYEVEFRFRHASGEERWMVGRGRAWYDADGTPVLLAGTGQDISARRQAEAALRRSEEQFRTLANSMSQLAWMAGPDGALTWYNNRWYEYTGTTFEEMKGWGWQSVHDPRELPRVIEHFKKCIETGEEWEDIFPLRRHDGEMRWHLSRALPLRDEHGRIVRWFGTNTDVTAQREAEETLRASEERFRLLADSSPSMIWLSGPDERLNWFNKAWIEFTGRAAGQLAGNGWIESVHPDDRAAVTAAIHAAFAERRELRVECRLRRADGVYRWIIDHAVPLAGAGGKFTGYVGSCLDITDQVEARKTLERQQTLLEEAVRARTAELQESNERLRLAERLASLGTLSAGLGHDMGNLLVPVRIRLQSLASAGLAPEYMEDVEAIRTSAEYLQRLANGLRMLAVDPRRVPVGESTELLTWWGDAGPLLKNALPRGIELVCKLPESPCNVGVPRAALTQAVFNLVQNAGDAMRARGKGTVTVAAYAEGERIVFTVSDNGPGMTPEVRARCMEPFFTTKPRGISTGLGLLLVYGIVREAGGAVELESEVGVGTTFRLLLPSEPGMARPAVGKHALVQVADPRLRGLVQGELKALGVTVSTAGASAAPPSPEAGAPATPARHDIFVVDSPADISSTAANTVVLLADSPPQVPAHVVAIGPRPKLGVLREALHAAVKGKTP